MTDTTSADEPREERSYAELKQENEYLWFAVIVFFLLWII